MNKATNILRTLVSAYFDVSPREVILSGVLSENFKLEEDHSSGSAYCHDVNHTVYGFEPAEGFIEVSGDTSGRSSNANGTWNVEKVTTFAHMLNDYHTCIFFVVIEEGKYMVNDCYINERIVTLYKAPDFKAIYASIEAKDLARWEQWLQ